MVGNEYIVVKGSCGVMLPDVKPSNGGGQAEHTAIVDK